MPEDTKTYRASSTKEFLSNDSYDYYCQPEPVKLFLGEKAHPFDASQNFQFSI